MTTAGIADAVVQVSKGVSWQAITGRLDRTYRTVVPHNVRAADHRGDRAVLVAVMFVGVMPDVRGGMLKSVLRQGQMPVVRMLELLTAVVLGRPR